MRKNNQSHRTRPMNNAQHSRNRRSCPSCLCYLWRALVKQIDKSRNQFCRDNNVVLECTSFSTNTHYPFRVTLSRQAVFMHVPKSNFLKFLTWSKQGSWHKKKNTNPRQAENTCQALSVCISLQTGQQLFCNWLCAVTQEQDVLGEPKS